MISLPLPPSLTKLVSLHDFALAAAAALSPKLVSLHDFAFGPAAAAVLSPKLVSLHDLAFCCCLVCEAWLT